jgi:general secretion pathway protein N
MKWLLAGLVAVGLALVFLPLSFVTGRLAPGLEAEQIDGSIWKGRLRQARYNGLPLGDIDVGLDPGRLLKGEASLAFTRREPRLAGRAGGTRSERRIEAVTGEVPLAILPPPVPAAVVMFEDASARFGLRGNCLSASGTVGARLTGVPFLGDTPALSGTPSCDGDALFAPLEAPGGRIGLDLRLWANGRWQAGLKLRAESPLAKAALAAAGFTLTDEGATWLAQGQAKSPA